MQYPGEFRPLNLMMLPFDERTCLYNNEFMLADNMDSSGKAIDLASDSETAPFMASPYPFKIEFYMGLVCLEGSMKVSLNLSEYRLGRGDVLVVLGSTDEKRGAGNLAGLAIGLTLVLVHIVYIPITGTSVNPARSIGPALFEGGAALAQLWLFIVAPLLGGAIAAGVWKCLGKEN